MRRVAAALVAVALVACSGGDDAGDTDAASAGTTIAESTSTTEDAATAPVDEGFAWLCRPDVADVCEQDMDATVVEADGSTTVEPFEPIADPSVDCFYVYPTVSRDPGDNSDLEAGTEERSVVRNQAARLQSVCGLYAPLYRQATQTVLSTDFGRFFAAMGPAYDDVLAAWRSYLAEDNDGRGVILLGHSQGSSHLLRLLQEEIDPDPEQRALLVSAMLAGVSAHESSLPHIPPCRADDQTGCVMSWSTYRDTTPPPEGAFFARPSGTEPAICTNPAALAGGSAAAHPYFPSALPVGAEVDTPFVALPGLVTLECRDVDGRNHLALTAVTDPGPRIDDVRGDSSPEWGLHIIDVNVVMGDLVAIATRQAASYSSG